MYSISNLYAQSRYSNVSEFTGERYTIDIDLDRTKLLNPAAIHKLKKDNYMLKDETDPQEAFARAAIAYASSQEHAQRLYDYASNLWFMYASPVLSNAGNPRGLPASCNLQYMGDSRKEIANTWEELFFLATMGAGTGIYAGALRSVGTGNSRGTSTPGLIPFLRTIDSITMSSIQGEVRRGAAAVYLDISHPEIEEFITMRKPTGGDPNRKCLNIHHAINIPDAFMEALRSGSQWDLIDPHTKEVKKSVDARELWEQILTIRMETGQPFLHFIDTSRRAVPQALTDKGLELHQSNLCVAPETMLLTSTGYKRIADLEGQTVSIWNTNAWSEVQVVKTSASSELLRVTMSDGTYLDCTPYHKFYIQDNPRAEPTMYEAQNLEPGMRIQKMCLPNNVAFGNKRIADAYSQGFYAGDGTEGKRSSYVYAPKAALFPFLKTDGRAIELDSTGDRYIWNHGDFEYPKYFVPTADFDVRDVLDWLAGLFDADASTSEGSNIELKSIHQPFLVQIKLLLQTLGVNCSINDGQVAGYYQLPLNNGTDDLGEFYCQSQYRLYISKSDTSKLIQLGMKTHRLAFIELDPDLVSTYRYVTVSSVVRTGRFDATYCFNEPLLHKGVFNGIPTGNCTEILLPTAPDRTATCFLSSVNLETFDYWKEDPLFIGDLVEMLDNVITVYCNKAGPELWRAVNSAKNERSIGLGMMGFHSYLQKNSIPFESAIAAATNIRIFQHIDKLAKAKSKELAVERGEAPDMVGTGERFSFLTAIAPNSTSSLLCGGVSPSIEPFVANAFTQKTARGALLIRNKWLESLLIHKYGIIGQDLDDIWFSISTNEGSVQHLTFLTDHEKAVFKTAFEMDQRWLIEHASSRQPFISQGQSLNLFFPVDTPKQYFHKVHTMAWSKGLKTLYYVRSRKASTVDGTTKIDMSTLKVNNSECVSCEG